MNPFTWYAHLTPEDQLAWGLAILVGGYVVVALLGEIWFTIFPRKCRVCRTELQGRQYVGYSDHVRWYCPTCKVEI